jgi:ParB family transcriptional regulator, chromosome partitioning protein
VCYKALYLVNASLFIKLSIANYFHFDSLVGSLEDIAISEISLPKRILRESISDVEELVNSVRSIGLLQPIVVRIQQSGYEIVAGCRRYTACKKLRLKKIPCHVVDLNDKQSYELSIIENIQRNSISPIEEGRAFSYYVNEFGWGGISELATSISKNPSYVCKRIKLAQLPTEIIDLINESHITPSVAEELFRIKDTRQQIRLASQIGKMSLSFRLARKFIESNIDFLGVEGEVCYGEDEVMARHLSKCIVVLKIALRKLSAIIENTERDWIAYEILMQHKNLLNDQIDVMIKERKKVPKQILRTH